MSDTPAHRLVVLRHGRAESFATDDSARRLTEAGRAEAASRGAWLAREAGSPDLALVSTATRARETWELVEEALEEAPGAQVDTRLDDALYGASPDALLDVLREVPESVGTVIFVGHNPTAADVAVMLADGSGDPAAFARLSGGLPTCGVVVYDLPGPWAELDAGSCSLVAYDG